MPRGDGHKERAKAYLLSHPHATNRQVCEAIHCSIRTATNARAELITDNLVPPAYGARGRGKTVNAEEVVTAATSDTFDVKTTSDLNKAVEEEMTKEAKRQAAADALADAELTASGEIDVAKLKKVLWRVVHRNTDDRIVVAAASALARIQQEANARAPGPGNPLTKREAKDRFLMMCKAVGVEFVIECINEWVGKDASNAPKAVDQSSPAPPPLVAAESPGDNAQAGAVDG